MEALSFPDATHWLVETDGTGGRLWMCNLVSGRQELVELDLPWDSIPTDPTQEWVANPDYLVESWPSRVLCSFRGLLLICLGRRHEHTLVLGDPLLNKWIKLPSLRPGRPNWYMSVGAFCPRTSTLLVSGMRTATFDLESAQWKVDPLPPCRGDPNGQELTQVCYLDGVFYCGFRTYPFERAGYRLQNTDPAFAIACYDPVNAREWRIVKEFYLTVTVEYPVFLAQQSDDKMLLCMIPEFGKIEHFQLLEASRSGGSSNELKIVPSPLMEDEHIGKRIKCLHGYHEVAEEDIAEEESWPAFHGKDGMLFWEDFDPCKGDAMTVASLKDGSVKEIKCTRHTCESCEPPRKYYYTAAPGTRELLDALVVKLNTA